MTHGDDILLWVDDFQKKRRKERRKRRGEQRKLESIRFVAV